MKHYYKDLAIKLFDNGYFPIPIKPKSKIPLMNKGESWQVNINKEQVQEWQENGKGGGGVALTGLCAIDCDVYDKEVSNKLVKYIKGNIDNIIIRIGQRPKFLVPCSPKSDIQNKWKNTFYDQEGEKQELEFLSAGDQYFIGYGIHPDTGSEFEWKWGDPLKTKSNDIVTLDGLDIAGIEDKFEELCKAAGWTRENKHQKTSAGKKKSGRRSSSGDPLESMKPSGDMADQAGLAELTAWLDLLPVDWVDDRDNWIQIGAATHHETAGSNEGWVVFDRWSRKSNKYKSRADTISRWESFDKNKGLKHGDDCVSRGTIIHVLKEAGLWGDAEKAGEAAREQVNRIDQGVRGEKAESDIVGQMNQKHAIIRINSKVRVMQEGRNIDNMLDLAFLSPADFKFQYSNKFGVDPKDPKKRKSLDKIWLESPKRREYKGIVFEPTGGDKTAEQLKPYYNLWRGLSTKPRKGDWRYFEDHIYNVIAGGNDTIGEWIVAWLARLVQTPGGERPGTCIVLKGGQGTGKGVFVNTVGRIFGEHFMPVSHASQVAGRFNSHLTNKILVFIDEGFWAGDKKAEGVLKSLITEPTLAIEQKGVDIIQIKNNVNIIIASNNDWIVPANLAERRFCVLDVSEKKQADKTYFNKIMQQMYKQGGIQAMLYDLLKMDISHIDLSRFEATSGLYEQKIHSMTTEMKYWHERLIDGEMLAYSDQDYSEFDEYKNPDWGQIDCVKIYQDYQIYSDKLKEKYPLSPTQFGIFLHKICPGVKKSRHGIGKRKMFYRFPDLDSCRKLFEKQIKQDIDWEDLTDDDEDLF